jgi:hypothetical protein
MSIARPIRGSAKRAGNRAEIVIFSLIRWVKTTFRLSRESKTYAGSSLPISSSSAISAAFIARLIKGCRGGAHAGYLISEIT